MQSLRLFPAKFFKVELSEHYTKAAQELELRTDLTKNLVSWGTHKDFRGIVSKDGFKIISSELGRGAVCVFEGRFQNEFGTIEIRVNKAFKVLFGILLSYPIIGFLLIWIFQGLAIALIYIPLLIVSGLVMRFAFIGLAFKIIAKTGMKKLTQALQIKSKEEF